jgi:hypothetical protein
MPTPTTYPTSLVIAANTSADAAPPATSAAIRRSESSRAPSQESGTATSERESLLSHERGVYVTILRA